MIVQLIEDDSKFVQIAQHLFDNGRDVELRICRSIDEFSQTALSYLPSIVLVDVQRPEAESLEDDFYKLRQLVSAPIVFITYGDTGFIRKKAINIGAEAVIDKSDLSEGLVRQLILHAAARKLNGDTSNIVETNSETEKFLVERNFQALRAPLTYLESGLGTLSDVMRETGKSGSREFVDHLRETIQAIRQYSEDDLSSQAGGALDLLIQQSLVRIKQLAESRNINLKVDWEAAGFQRIGSYALAQLGVQHLLEGVLRCCSSKDGVWMQGEKAEQTGSSVIKVHMSRRVLPSKDMLFPDAKPSPLVGLDALSSMQLGGLLLMLTPKQVELSSEERQQLLCVYL